MEVPEQFTTGQVIPPITAIELKLRLNKIVGTFVEPPYSILITAEMLTRTMAQLDRGENVFILNVPFFVDCPDLCKARGISQEKLIFRLLFAYPFLDIGAIDKQYIYADLKFGVGTELPELA